VEDVLPLLKLLEFFWLYCCGYDGRSGLYIDDMFPFIVI
jgi:hypothetical protein